jgi:hypothetical protein
MNNRRSSSPLPKLLRRLSHLIGIETDSSPIRRSLEGHEQSEVQLELELGMDLLGRARQQAKGEAKR